MWTAKNDIRHFCYRFYKLFFAKQDFIFYNINMTIFRCHCYDLLVRVGGVHMSVHLDQLSDVKQMILKKVKQSGSVTIAQLAHQLHMTKESVRQHLLQLTRDGWVKSQTERTLSLLGGRPSKHYRLTIEGEHLFPKNYDVLAIEMMDQVADDIGPDGLKKILTSMTHTRVQQWEDTLDDLPIAEKLNKLKSFYLEDDPYMDVLQRGRQLSLVESNCPFLNVATTRPALCSVTVSTLSRLLGYEVVRTEKFQNGDGRCVFNVNLDKPIDHSYAFDWEK